MTQDSMPDVRIELAQIPLSDREGKRFFKLWTVNVKSPAAPAAASSGTRDRD
jgi:hypothetical protein